MALTQQTMTDDQRKSVAIEYLKAFDDGGVTSEGGSILDLFADDAQVYFPKWGLASGKEQIGRLFGDVPEALRSIEHHFSHFNWIFSGTNVVAAEETSHGEHKDGRRRAGDPEWGAWRRCDVFEIRDWKTQRLFIYLDPGYAGRATACYPWLSISGNGPYYAALVTGGTLDTKGGPKTTPDGQVVDLPDRPIPGLYGVGNGVASASGRSYWAGGATPGPIIAFAYRAAQRATSEPMRLG